MNAAAAAPEPEPDDAEVVDPDLVEQPADGDPGQELAVVEKSQQALTTARIVRGETPEEVIKNATLIANAMKHLVDAQDFSVNLGGKKPHLEIGAWQALGVLLGALGGEALHPECVHSRPTGERTTYQVHEVKKKWGGPKGNREVVETIERDYEVDGNDYEARVEVKTAAGVVVAIAEGMCSRTESNWADKPDPAVKSMAETRAASRAFRAALGWVVAMAGYETTPAEEMPSRPPAATDAPKVLPYGSAVPEAQLKTTREAIGYLLDVAPEHNSVGVILNAIEDVTEKKANENGFAKYLPTIVCGGIVRTAKAVKEKRAAPAETAGEGDPAGETAEEREAREYAEGQMAEQAAAAAERDA